MNTTTSKLWVESALLPDGWARNVEIIIDSQGNIENVNRAPDANGEKITGALLPGIPNLHSHAHQRAMAGLGEKSVENRGATKDTFWSWRKVMYHYLERIQPDHMFHIASQLYVEMLKAGYTCVAEFQYLHHDVDGTPYSNRAEMTQQCMNAASNLGLGFTALPVLYKFGGFGGQESIAGQRRFLNDHDGFLTIVDQLKSLSKDDPNVAVGIAPHSLRAVTQDLLQDVLNSCSDKKLAAVHIHIAEQMKEVGDCLAWSKQRPVEWLLSHFEVNQNWCLIHATHTNDDETRAMANSGLVVGLCPTTEANLGDGFFNAIEFSKHQGRWGVGSDSQISISPVEELRWFEYGQRLLTHGRNVLASSVFPSTARSLVNHATESGAQACGRLIGKIEKDYRADFIVLDNRHTRTYGRMEDNLIDSWVFSGNENLVTDVFVGGVRVIEAGHHVQESEIADNYRKTLDELSE